MANVSERTGDRRERVIKQDPPETPSIYDELSDVTWKSSLS